MKLGIVGVATASGVVVGAVPIPIADAMILTPLEVAEVNAIAKVYGIKNDERSKKFFNTIIEVGTVSAAARAAISALKAIPVLNIGAATLNAIIAGSFVAALGEGTIYIFEQIYLGNKSYEDVDWVTKILESKLSASFVEKVQKLLADAGDIVEPKDVVERIIKLFGSSKK